MKKIEAIIRPEKFDEVKEALNKLNIKGLNVTQISGCGNQKGQKGTYRGAVVDLVLLPKTKIEIVTDDDLHKKVVDAIVSVARTGAVGDGKIFVSDISETIRIRTGETGNQAL